MFYNTGVFELRLCETREYSSRLLEHWLHTIQKKSAQFFLIQNEKKLRLLCSEDLSPILLGSRCVPAAPRQRTHLPFSVYQTKGPLLPIKRLGQFEDRTQKTHISPLEHFLPILSQTPNAQIHFHWTPFPERKRKRALKKIKQSFFEPERRFDQWESQAWFSFKLRRFLGPLIRRFFLSCFFSSSRKKAEELEQIESFHEREDPKRAILDKLSRPLFRVRVQISHPCKEFWDGFSLPYLGTLGVRRGRAKPILLSAEELASLLSLPNAKTHAIFLHTEPTVFLPPPPQKQMEEEDRKRHLYLIGKTGMGKSTALLKLFEEDVEKARAIVLLDPHGDLIEDAIKILPSGAKPILLDPSDSSFPLALNPLESGPEEDANLKTSALLEMFEVLAKGSWGPRLEYILRNILHLLILVPNTSFLDLPLALTDKRTCRHFLRQVKDLELHRFFEDEFFVWDERSRQEYIAPILNKVGPLLSIPQVRRIFGQTRGKFHFSRAFDEKKTVLINLSKGKLGEDASGLLGMIFISMIQSTLLRRAKLPAEKRSIVCVFLDEFQNFASKTLLEILAESRKYGLALTLANQYLSQVPPEIQDAVLGNVGSLICFRTSYADAQILAPSLGLSEEDLTGLLPFQAYAKLLREQKSLPLFQMDIEKPSFQEFLKLETLRKCSLERFGRPLKRVDEKLAERYNNRRRPLQKGSAISNIKIGSTPHEKNLHHTASHWAELK